MIEKLDPKANKLSLQNKLPPFLKQNDVNEYLSMLHNKHILVPIEKAANIVAII